jgi:fermentation-respiration switch protein FrsA (DUF1100 family)
MRFASTTTSDGVCEQDFTLDDIPGVLWFPAGTAGPRPLVLLGHGGGGHKRAPGVLARARRLVTGGRFAAAAIDMPGFGDRPKTAEDERFVAEIRARRAAGRIAIPVEFLLQWDDELVPRADGLALFDAFGSAEKTLHANPGRHADIPAFELDSTERFFARHLGQPE